LLGMPVGEVDRHLGLALAADSEGYHLAIYGR
jgi:hypothetical protein